MDNFSIKTNAGEYDLACHVNIIGRDILVAIFGGEKPHIGAVAAANPRPSLRNPATTSATASVICFIGHKEDDIAKYASEKIAAALNTQVVVTAGIHWDHISEDGIKKVTQNSHDLVRLVIDNLHPRIE